MKMLTSKQRAFLRAMANPLDTMIQIGKDGVTQNVLNQITETIETHELLKLRVLDSSGLTAREACNQIAEALEAEPVQCIGTKFVIYKKSKENEQIRLPAAK